MGDPLCMQCLQRIGKAQCDGSCLLDGQGAAGQQLVQRFAVGVLEYDAELELSIDQRECLADEVALEGSIDGVLAPKSCDGGWAEGFAFERLDDHRPVLRARPLYPRSWTLVERRNDAVNAHLASVRDGTLLSQFTIALPV